MNKDVKALVRALKAQGWRIREDGAAHYVAFAPDGEGIVPFAKTPSCHRTIKNTVAALKRHGYRPRVPRRPRKEAA